MRLTSGCPLFRRNSPTGFRRMRLRAAYCGVMPLVVMKLSTKMKILLTMFFVIAVMSCGKSPTLSPFTSDGCSLFPDKSIITQSNWCSCCLKHDVAYWRGGTKAERAIADLELKKCVEAKTGNAALATLMYEGVRAGGSPYFVNWYRWGYGWGYERKYQSLTPEEEARAAEILSEYYKSVQKAVCPSETAA